MRTNLEMTWKNTHTRMNWRSDSSRRNGVALCCGVKNPANLLKTFVGWYSRNKWPERQKFVAVPINSNMNSGSGVSRGPISRRYESVRHFCVYPYFNRLFRSLRSHGLPFRRISNKRSAYSRHTGCGWRHHHDSSRIVHMDDDSDDLEGDNLAGSRVVRVAHH